MSAAGAPARLLAVFGDSIAEGLGARGVAFPVLVAAALGAELIDLSETARTVATSLTLVEQARDCDLVLIAHGPTEALRRPTDRALRLVPPRWRRAGWLDPRPYFSSRRGRRLGQKVESGLRWRVKLLLIRAFGSVQWCPPAEYEAALADLAGAFPDARVVILGVLAVDDRFFPGAEAEFERYGRINREVAAATGALFVDVADSCRRWEDFLADHFHPDGEGHRRIAARIEERLEAGGPD